MASRPEAAWEMSAPKESCIILSRQKEKFSRGHQRIQKATEIFNFYFSSLPAKENIPCTEKMKATVLLGNAAGE